MTAQKPEREPQEQARRTQQAIPSADSAPAARSGRGRTDKRTAEVKRSSFISRNRDNLFMLVISLIIGGVGGFFSALLILKDDINKVDDRVIVLENDAVKSWRPGEKKLEETIARLDALERVITEFQRKNEVDALLRDRLRQITEETRKQTASEVRAILKENS